MVYTSCKDNTAWCCTSVWLIQDSRWENSGLPSEAWNFKACIDLQGVSRGRPQKAQPGRGFVCGTLFPDLAAPPPRSCRGAEHAECDEVALADEASLVAWRARMLSEEVDHTVRGGEASVQRFQLPFPTAETLELHACRYNSHRMERPSDHGRPRPPDYPHTGEGDAKAYFEFRRDSFGPPNRARLGLELTRL